MNRGKQFGVYAIVTLLFIVICGACLLGLYAYTNYGIDYSSIDHIRGYLVAPNKFLDLSGDIAVKSADDIGFKVEGEYNIIIYYGKQVIKVPPTAFESAEFRSALSEIGIRIFHHVNDDGTILYKVTYWDVPVDEYSIVS